MSLDDVQKIKERLGIEEIIGSYIQIERAGKNFKARCPFHNEKTPSFVISPDRGTYYCFGCGAKGDIISFVQEFEGLNFIDSLKILADKAGIKLSTNQKSADDSKHDRLRKVMEESTKYYISELQKKPEALKYLQSRGLTSQTIENWRIGFAPKGWRNLYEYLKRNKFTDLEIENAGLIKKNQSGEFYDRFRSRIIFPIFDTGGRVVAFTGRIFEGTDEEAKYLNSPETILFEKSKILYGFDRAKNQIRKSDFSILVEGQMDLIMSHQAGYKNTVASSGTALTEDQLRLISRISDKLVIAYDSDGAGFRASEKAWQMALKMGFDIKIAPIPENNDPADIIYNDVNHWKEIIRNSKHIIEIITNKLLLNVSDQRSRGKAVSKGIIPYLASVQSDIDQSYFIKHVSEKLNISESAIQSEVKNYEPQDDQSFDQNNLAIETHNPIPKVANQSVGDSLKVEKEIFGILFWQKELAQPIIKYEDFNSKIKSIIGENFDEIFNLLESEKDGLVIQVEQKYYGVRQDENKIDIVKLKNNIVELLKNLKLKYLLITRNEYHKKLKDAERLSDEDVSRTYLEKIAEISKQIHNLNS